MKFQVAAKYMQGSESFVRKWVKQYKEILMTFPNAVQQKFLQKRKVPIF